MIIGFDQETSIEDAGCKAHNLSLMWRAGLPVPRGFSVTWDGIESLGIAELTPFLAQLGNETFSVRSSAIQEDAHSASFAGILVSRLNITKPEGVLAALGDIRKSAVAPAALGYSRQRDVGSSIRVAAVVQAFITAEASGVLFMRDPLTGARDIIVEGCWGLGPGMVEGLVRPDRWIISNAGKVISSHIADKDIAVVPSNHGGTTQMPVDPACRRRPSVSLESLEELSRLALACERLFGSPQDIEWAIYDNRVWLLQSRPITNSGTLA